MRKIFTRTIFFHFVNAESVLRYSHTRDIPQDLQTVFYRARSTKLLQLQYLNTQERDSVRNNRLKRRLMTWMKCIKIYMEVSTWNSCGY